MIVTFKMALLISDLLVFCIARHNNWGSCVMSMASNQGRRHEFEGGRGGQCIGRWLVNTVKTLKFEKRGGVHDHPPSS